MIQLPRRSVTRFFIPLIDVLTLLFCIFLLMPLIKATGQAEESAPSSPPSEPTLAPELAEPRPPLAGQRPPAPPGTQDVLPVQQELERLRREKIETLQQRLFIRVLEIDADTGLLYFHEAGQRVEIRNADDAAQLIVRQRREAGNRELYYLFLFPRRVTGFPEERQVKQYESWFKGVAHGTDNPLAAR